MPVARVDGSTYLALGSNILTYSKDGANCMDSKGVVLWNQTYEMQNPMVDINGSVVAIGDYNGRLKGFSLPEKNIIRSSDTANAVLLFINRRCSVG